MAAYILSAKRSAVGVLGGAFSQIPIADAAGAVIASSLQQANIDGDEIDEIIMGNVLPAAQGMNLARQAAFKAGIAQEKTAFTINQVCASGLRAVALAADSIDCGAMDLMVAGGLESMSATPHAVRMRFGKKLGDAALIDTMQYDGLHCALEDYGMGITAENVAEKYQISRRQQDEFAYRSQQKAAQAIAKDVFKNEIHPIKIQKRGKEIIFDMDEHPRLSDMAALEKLQPVFKKDGTVTAGNSSGINDGAAVLVIGGDEKARKYPPLARIVGYAVCGVAPAIMGIGPAPAIEKLLAKTGFALKDIDLFELNEAFAAQSLAVLKLSQIPEEKVNIHGGAIALGHPLGASGARILVTLLHALQAQKSKRGVAALCAGGGMGIALMVEMV